MRAFTSVKQHDTFTTMKKPATQPKAAAYPKLISGIATLLEESRRSVVRAANCFMTATYWEIGRRIVEFEQGGKRRAEYGDELLERLSRDLTERHGRGFSGTNLKKVSAVLPAQSQHSPDTVGQICRTVRTGDSSDSVGRIRREAKLAGTVTHLSNRHALAPPRSRRSFPAPVVALCETPHGEGRKSPPLLRGGSPARRLERATARPANRQPLL